MSTVAGEFHQTQLGAVMDDAVLVGDVVTTWQEKGENRPTFLFAVNCDHARHLYERFVEAGIGAAYIDGDSPEGERQAIFERFRAGEVRVICSVGVLTTGVDEDVRCIIDAQPTKSEIRHVQKIGRGLRTAPGKDHLLVLDHAGNHLRLGEVTASSTASCTMERQRPRRNGRPKSPSRCRSSAPSAKPSSASARRHAPNAGTCSLPKPASDTRTANWSSSAAVSKAAWGRP